MLNVIKENDCAIDNVSGFFYDFRKERYKKMKKIILSKLCALSIAVSTLFSFLPVFAGTATVSGQGYNVTATATTTYVSCSVTGSSSSGSTATVMGWARGIDGSVYIGARSGSTYVNWYISSVSGYSAWSYCKGKGILSTGRAFTTTAAYA